MLGKRNRRAKGFSTCHAVLLAAFIVLSQVLGLGNHERDFQVSAQDALQSEVLVRAKGCAALEDAEAGGQGCALVFKYTPNGTAAVGVLVWQHGVDL